jgi:tetratricopeptide (TPR) repeat protein
MAKVSLRIYNREIEGMIEHGQRLDEAVAHCRHILKTFPKHLETYRLLGKAYLESKRYKEAVDIFQRVLVAVPDDFVSHVGMSIIADDQKKLDDAIWHMERAFEVQPSNAAIQGELQRLFGRRDGVEPPKIRLTRGALAHMYVQGELYNQAIAEIRAVLGNDPQRADIQVLLAKAYFRNGQNADAAEICKQLFKRFPYCLDANRILAEISASTQRADTTQVYRRRVIELDPYAAFAQDSLFRSADVADSAVSLERLEYAGQADEAGAPWREKPGIGLEADSTVLGSAASQPEWLRAAAPSDASASPIARPAERSIEETPPISTGKDEIPDFLRQAGWKESSGQHPEGPAAFAAEPGPAAPAVEGDLPDWVRSLAPAQEGESVPQTAAPSSERPDWLRNLGGAQPVEPAAPSEATPDWLKSLGARELDEPAAKTPSAPNPFADFGAGQQPAPAVEPEPAAPDWLKGFEGDLETPISKGGASSQPKQEAAPSWPVASKSSAPAFDEFEAQPPAATGPDPAAYLGGLGTSAQEQDDALAWLESLAARHGANPEELVTDPNARSEVAPEWVDKAKAMGEATPSAVEESGEPEDKTGIWLRKLEASEAETFVSKKEEQEPAKAEPADWLSAFGKRDELAGMAAETPKDEMPMPGKQAAPDWLGGLDSMPAEESIGPESEDVPEWLRGTSSPPVQVPESVRPQEASTESTSAADLPEWLAGLDKEESTAQSAVSSDNLPNWLQEEAEPPVAVPTYPADWRPVESKPASESFPVPEVESAMEETALPQKPAPKPEKKTPAQPMRPRPVGVQAKLGEASLESAQAELGRGNIGAALDHYGKLIRKGKFLEEVIRDLREALYRYPVEVPIWQALGDAYMRANRLQEALDAYTKAEELLR